MEKERGTQAAEGLSESWLGTVMVYVMGERERERKKERKEGRKRKEKKKEKKRKEQKDRKKEKGKIGEVKERKVQRNEDKQTHRQMVFFCFNTKLITRNSNFMMWLAMEVFVHRFIDDLAVCGLLSSMVYMTL